MTNYQTSETISVIKQKILFSAALLFIEKGITATTFMDIAKASGLSKNKILYEMKNKEEIIAELVKYVLEGQFEYTAQFLKGKTEDKILFYAAETTLQLYMAESSEAIREIYTVAYSLPASSDIIQKTITGKLQEIFKEHLPDLETKDFYKLEIASGGIMRGFLKIPCDMWFTMDQKIESFLETTLKLYDVPKEKIREAIDFVAQFDYPTLAKGVIDKLLAYLQRETK